MVKKLAVLIFVTLMLWSNAYSQAELDEALNKLTGPNEKTWTYSRFEKYLGNNKCKAGESWTFLRNHKVIIKKCVKGDIQSEEKAWSAEKRNALDIAMKVGDTEYLVLFPPPKKGSHRQGMILRVKGAGKGEPTKDLIFYYEVD